MDDHAPKGPAKEARPTPTAADARARRDWIAGAFAVAAAAIGRRDARAQAKATPLPPPRTGGPLHDSPQNTASSPAPGNQPPPQPSPPSHAGRASDAIPRRRFGRHDVEVSALAMGGHHLGDAESFSTADDIVARGLDAGIDFFDNCWEYHDGKCENWLGRALAGKRDRAFLMTKVCTHGRDGALALRMLEQSLTRLGTDHLDLWQIHAISFDNDPALAYAKGGVIEALETAKRQGKTRFVGFTGHKHPDFHMEMIRRGFPFDAVQMPLNPLDAHFFSFQRSVLPEAQRRGMAVLGMKSMGGTADVVKQGVLSAEDCLRYAMSLPGVTTTIAEMNSVPILEQNLKIARGFQPLDEPAMQKLRDRCARFASDGRFELYKVSLKYDNPATRHPHGFPMDAKQKEVQGELQGGETMDDAPTIGAKGTP